MVYQFITTPPVSEYFSDLVDRLSDLCFHLDALLHSRGYVFLHSVEFFQVVIIIFLMCSSES